MQLTSPRFTSAGPSWQRRVSRIIDTIASTSGLLIGCGLALEILAITTFPDPRLKDLPIRVPIAIACGVGGGFGLSTIFFKPTPLVRRVVGVCLILAALLRACAFTYISLRREGFSTVVTLAPIATMTFPFLLGVMLWRRAHIPDAVLHKEDT